MVSLLRVLKYFKQKADPDAGDAVTMATLQKLAYYAQGFSLALFDEPLFEDRVYAGSNGPVFWTKPVSVKEYETLVFLDDWDEDVSGFFSQPQIELLDDVWRVYGQFAGWRLRELVWDDALWQRCWKAAVIDRIPAQVIRPEEMKRHFKGLLAAMEHGDGKE